MRKNKFTEAQMIAALKEVDGGTKFYEVCRKLGITAQTFYRWRARFGGMDVSEAQRLKQLEEENRCSRR